MRFTFALAILPIVAMLPACAPVDGTESARILSNDKLMTECVFDVAPRGTYSWELTDEVPVAVPVKERGGTDAGAAKLNACMQAKVAANTP